MELPSLLASVKRMSCAVLTATAMALATAGSLCSPMVEPSLTSCAEAVLSSTRTAARSAERYLLNLAVQRVGLVIHQKGLVPGSRQTLLCRDREVMC